jgi:hypothetical protein
VLALEQTALLRDRHHLVENLMIASCSTGRSRFLLNTVGTQTASSVDSPMNQRNNRL